MEYPFPVKNEKKPFKQNALSTRYIVFSLLILFALSFFAVFSKIPGDDHWWHMLTGRYFLENGVVPKQDLFSFTYYGKPWVNWEWLSGVLMVICWDLWGSWGLISLRWLAVSMTLLFVWLHHRRYMTWEKTESEHTFGLLSFLLVTFLLLIILGRVSDRPHLYALPLLAAVHFYSFSMANIPRVRTLGILMLLMTFWILIHPSWILGIVVYAVVMVDAVILEIKQDGGMPWSGPRKWWLLSVPALCFPIFFVHDPIEYYASVVKIFQTSRLSEWRPLSYYLTERSLPLMVFLVVVVCWVASLLSYLKAFQKLFTWFLLACLVNSFLHVRFTTVFAVLVGPSIFRILLLRWPHWSFSLRKVYLLTGLVSAVGASLILSTHLLYGTLLGGGVDLRGNPVGSADFMQKYRLYGNVYCNDLTGQSYLAFRGYPHTRSFIDGRIPQLFPESFLKEFQQSGASKDNFYKLLRIRPIEFIILKRTFSTHTMQLSRWLSQHGDFVLSYFDLYSVLWVRKKYGRIMVYLLFLYSILR